MAKRKRKKAEPLTHLSAGPLPQRLMPQFVGLPLVFTDASRLRHGGLAAVLYMTADAEPLLEQRSVPLDGSNELELAAALFGLEQAALKLPNRRFALFSDNMDAITRLIRAQTLGTAQDATLGDIASSLTWASFHWIKGHGRCRGNALADAQARIAASP